MCWLWHNDDRYFRLWSGLPQRPARPDPIEPSEPCKYEGPVTEWSTCPPPKCDRDHVRQCMHPKADWDTCSRGGRCKDCKIHSRYESVGEVRNLAYFVFPIADGGIWQWNADQILKRAELFNGKRVIAIATGQVHQQPRMRPPKLDSVEKVQAHFGSGFEFITVEHVLSRQREGVKPLGEVVAWHQLWESVLPGGPNDVTFYAHAKGVGKTGQPTIRAWSEMMYATCLDDWETVQGQLRQFPITGTFKKLGYCFTGLRSSWHYTGTFYWVRNADFAARAWREIPQEWGGTEAIPGMIYSPEEAGCLLHEDFGAHMNMYLPNYFGRVIEPAYKAWQLKRGIEENAWESSSSAEPSPGAEQPSCLKTCAS